MHVQLLKVCTVQGEQLRGNTGWNSACAPFSKSCVMVRDWVHLELGWHLLICSRSPWRPNLPEETNIGANFKPMLSKLSWREAEHFKAKVGKENVGKENVMALSLPSNVSSSSALAPNLRYSVWINKNSSVIGATFYRGPFIDHVSIPRYTHPLKVLPLLSSSSDSSIYFQPGLGPNLWHLRACHFPCEPAIRMTRVSLSLREYYLYMHHYFTYR